MRSRSAGSSASADLAPGTLIAGFRLERRIGYGSQATVYEATQLSLNRRVALKLLRDRATADRVRRLTWPEHPGAVRLFGTGDSEHGPWLAMQLMSGETLETASAPLDDVAAALAAAHAAGMVHGGVSARNVFVGAGRAYLSDFGLAGDDASAEDDRAALAELVRDHPPPRAHRRRAVLVGAAVAAIAGVALAAVLVAGNGESGDVSGAAPSAPAGTRPIGSDLAPGEVESVGCDGGEPSGASLACTISQRELAGRAIVAPADGTITSWAVRGARGTLALQVLRGPGGQLIEIERSADETVPDSGLQVVKADLAVAAGDRVGLVVAPGASVGIRRGGPSATIERWFGPLLEPGRPPERPAGTGLDHELLLRVDVRPGTAIEPIESLSGDDATDAPDGRRLASRDVEVGGGEVRTVTVVVLGSAVAVDLFDGTRRLARAPVPGADGRGQLSGLTVRTGSLRVRWRNPGGADVDRTVDVVADGLS